MTLLEVLLAVLMLGLITASIAGALSFVLAQERMDDRRLSAYELANRLLLQYLDDETVIDRMHGQPLQYGNNRFMWDLTVDRVTMNMKEPEAGSGRPRAQYKDRFELVTVHVWYMPDRSLGRSAAQEATSEPLAELSRVLDPGAARNSDAMTRLGKDQTRLMQLVVRMGIVQGTQQPGTRSGQGNRPGATPAGGRTPSGGAGK